MRPSKALSFLLGMCLLVPLMTPVTVTAAGGSDYFKIAEGIAVYLGVLPAAMIRGYHEDHPEAVMHDGIPRGRDAYHITVALFDVEDGERIEDARVEARVASPGLVGVSRRLEPMTIADVITYGHYFMMSGNGPYRIELSIVRAGAGKPVVVEFSYDQ